MLGLCHEVRQRRHKGGHLHHRAAKDVLLSGRHLLLEKPMCLDLAQCDELIALARGRNLVLAVGHELRVSSLWGRVKELIESGAVGEPLYVKLVEQGRILYREPFEEQAARAERTWGRYRRVALSPLVGEYQRRFNAMREREIALARKP